MQAKTQIASDLGDPVAAKSRTAAGIIWLRRRKWRALFVLALLAAAYWWFSGEDAGPATRPLFATIERGDIENAVTAAGTLQPSQFVDVGAQVSGQLRKLFVDVGDVVAAGDLVAEIDATVQENRVEASRASLRASEAQLSARQAALKLAEANAARQTRLMEDDATTQADFDNAMNSLASAQSSLVQLQSNIAQSRASLATDEAQLGYTRIYAPMSGTIVSIRMKEGQTLNANQSTPIILTIADLSTMTVEADVSEADVTKLTPGMEVYFTTLGSSGRRWYSTLRQVLPTPEVANNVVLYTALFDVDNADQSLLSSMTAQVFFVTASARNVLKVPVGALSYDDGAARPATAAQGIVATAASGMGGGMGTGGSSDVDREAMRADMQARRAAGGNSASPAMGGGMGRTQAVNGEPTIAYVQLARDDGTTERREVRIGVTTRIAAEVLSGLSEGDRVVAGVLQTRTNDQPARNSGLNFR